MHQSAVLGGEQDAAVAEPADQRTLHFPENRVPLFVRDRAAGHGDRVLVREPQPVAFRALGQSAQVATAVQQVVDELAASGFFLAYGDPLRPLIALGERVDGLCRGAQHVVHGNVVPGRPVRPGGCHVGADHDAQAQARLRGPLAQRAARIQFASGQSAPGRRGVREDAGVPLQVLVVFLGRVPARHVGLPEVDALSTSF